MRPGNVTRENISMKMVATMATVLIIATFSLVVTYPFVNWGDPTLVLNNPVAALSGSAALKALFSSTTFDTVLPLTTLSFSIEQGFAGLNSNTYHFDNIVLSLINTLLVLAFLLRVFPQRPVAVAAAVFFFAVHPLHVETVSWVSERKDLLAAFFFLMCLLTYLESHRSGWRWYLSSVISFIFSLLSSPLCLAWPFFIYVVEAFVYRESRLGQVTKKAAPYFLVAVAYVVLQQRTFAALSPPQTSLPFVPGVALSLQTLIFFLGKSILPSHLSALYEAGLYHLSVRDGIAAAGVVVGIAVAAWQLENIRRPLGFGVLFFLIMLLPALPVVPLPHRGIFADSDFYICGLGLILSYALIFSELVRFKTLQVPLMGFGALAIGAYLAVGHNQTAEWASSEKLWGNVVKQEPGSSRAQLNLGEVLFEKGETIGAGIHFFQAVKLDPRSAQGYSDLGMVFLSRQRYEKAQEYLKQAVVLAPARADVRMALGMAYVKNNQREEGLAQWRQAETLDPALHEKILLLSKHAELSEKPQGSRTK